MSLMKEKVGSVGKEEDQHQGASRESASGGSHKHVSKLLLVFVSSIPWMQNQTSCGSNCI